MEHENEILGTVMAILFLVLVIGVTCSLWSAGSTAPFWLALCATIALGGTAIWACVKVFVYWYNKLKSRLGKK